MTPAQIADNEYRARQHTQDMARVILFLDQWAPLIMSDDNDSQKALATEYQEQGFTVDLPTALLTWGCIEALRRGARCTGAALYA